MFSFVSSDVNAKIEILKAKLASNPRDYKTVKKMVSFEVSGKLTNVKDSGCRTLLRLNRALGTIYWRMTTCRGYMII